MQKQYEVIHASTVPFAFDATFYTNKYLDLRGIEEDAAAGHYLFAGIAEGRQGHRRGSRPQFIDYVSKFASVLEIGPFYNPTARGENTRYLDILDARQLRARAELLGFDVSGCPERIHYLGEIFDIDETFDAVVSSHCVEHQPDLIHHLEGVARVLRPGGQYLLCVPDKRYCFDHFIPETTLADIMQAHSERRTIHTLRSVIEHHALTTHNDPHAHWAGNHGEQFPAGQIDRVADAIRNFNTSDTYIDVHSWTFTPTSFFYIMDALYQLGMTRLKPVEIFPTLHNEQEFFGVLDLQENPAVAVDDLKLPIRSEPTPSKAESQRLRDDIITDLRRRLDQADAERRDVQATLSSVLAERSTAPSTSLVSRVLRSSGYRRWEV